ncbi:N(alpha)-acetyltransferase 38, NatC auxiliary [Perkinsus olseni]|uniref:U6 snRNA-associated Sm-like protein LSm8 n=1 Tax=Perkinsus olseni TaxID=32597 RepID=A0A7J6LU12_PEROL|nr:N(alpha)-acetyltransferase 38, NatC auxiliary [Perkinsus olseni]KAF4668580.1 N(alpha)-acetyltransferase 38, NatC auxiliary [Perkinsus olseni]
MSTAAAAAYHHHPTTALANTSSMLEPMLNTEVLLVTADGKVLLGKFKGFDQSLNVVLSECKERVYSMVEGVETLHHGLYLIRGDDVVSIGEVDEDIDARIDQSTVIAAQLKSILH